MIRFDAATIDSVPIPLVNSSTASPRENEMKAMKIERRQWPRPSRLLLLLWACLLLFAFKTMSQTTNQTPRPRARESLRSAQTLGNDAMSPLFEAVVEATEEAIYNSLFKATTVTGRDGHRVEALPIEKTVDILKRYGAAK
jgi:Peptidase family S58